MNNFGRQILENFNKERVKVNQRDLIDKILAW